MKRLLEVKKDSKIAKEASWNFKQYFLSNFLKPGYHGTGSASRRELQARQERQEPREQQEEQEPDRDQEEQQLKSQSASPRRSSSNTRAARAARVCKPMRSLTPSLGRYAASPGVWSWERFARVLAVSFKSFFTDLLGEARPLKRPRWPGRAAASTQLTNKGPKSRAKRPQSGPTWSPNRSKNGPKSSPNRPKIDLRTVFNITLLVVSFFGLKCDLGPN